MPAKSRQLMLRKPRPTLAETGRLANENPDKLARRLLRARSFSKNRKQKDQIWHLLQNLGSERVVSRAAKTIASTQSTSELVSVLNAAEADLWVETAPQIIKRFDTETHRIGLRAPTKDMLARLEALCTCAARVRAELSEQSLSKVLKHSSTRLRGVGALYALKMQRDELVAELLPITWERGPGAPFAEEAVRKFGDAGCAAAVWPRALAARKDNQSDALHRYLKILGALGAFDVMVCARYWIEEDFAKSEDAGWLFAEAWCDWVRAKLAAGESTKAEALAELRWYLHEAERQAIPELRLTGEGVFHLARAFQLLGAEDDAAALTRRAAKRSLPNLEKFPELLPHILSAGLGNAAPTAWLAAAGDLDAQRKIVENWPVLLREGRKPVNWDMRDVLNAGVLRATLLEALNCATPGASRRVLKFLCGEAAALAVRDELMELAQSHASEVVRWKASRTLAALQQMETELSDEAGLVRWVRLDAAVLIGSPKPTEDAKRAAKSLEKPVAGMLPPERNGQGWRLAFEKLRAPARKKLLAAIQSAPLGRALHRRAPFGPAQEERPDVKALRELAPPRNQIDEQMAEMAQSVMELWIYGDDQLTLDLKGIGEIAEFLSSGMIVMDEDDIVACGAFIGEALRKRFGGEWSGYDGNYRLEIQGETFDPLAVAKHIFERKEVYQATVGLSNMYLTAEARFNPPKKPALLRDTQASFERAIRTLCEMPKASMNELMAETRVFSYRMEALDWPDVLAACDPLLENTSGARIAAAIAIYAPGMELARAWARWGKRRDTFGLPDFLCEAMSAAAERDDLEAMPDWTVLTPATRFSFLNALRKRMNKSGWRKVLMLLLRQRAAAGDVGGVAWCLFSYKYEFPDSLALLGAFCAMTVSARQTVLRATRHCTRDAVKVFRPVWAEALRDPSGAVTLAALDAVIFNRPKTLRHLVEGLKVDGREEVASMAAVVLESFNAA